MEAEAEAGEERTVSITLEDSFIGKLADPEFRDWLGLGSSNMVKRASYQSALCVNGELYFYYTVPMPRRWHRFWQRMLLGWRWEKVDE